MITQLIKEQDGEGIKPSMELLRQDRNPMGMGRTIAAIENDYDIAISEIDAHKAMLESAHHDEVEVQNDDESSDLNSDAEVGLEGRSPQAEISLSYNRDRAVAYATKFAYGESQIFKREVNDCTGFANACMWTGYCKWSDDTLDNKKANLRTTINNQRYFGSNWYGRKYGSTSYSSGPWMRVIELETEMKKTSGTGARGTVYNWSNPDNINGIRKGDIIQFYFKRDSQSSANWNHTGIVVDVDASITYNGDTIILAMHSTDNAAREYSELISSNQVTKVRMIRPATATFTNN